MNRFFTTLQKTVKDRSTVIFGGGQSPTGSVSNPNSEKRPDDEEEEISVTEAVQQALKTRNKGILKHISCLSPEAYSDVKELRVWASTFNVNGDKPQPEHDFRSWLVHPGDKWPERSGETADWEGPDILFVGFEEINPLNAISLVAGAGMENIDAWNTCIDCALNCKALPDGYTAAQNAIDGLSGFTGEESPRRRNYGFGVQAVKGAPAEAEQYVHVGGRNLVGLYLAVWVRKPLLPHVSSWQAGEVRTGTMGFGNKGAVMVRLRVFDEPLCCICAHIASGEAPADALKRQADFLHICRTASFSEPSADNPNYIVHAPLDHDIIQGEWTRSDLASKQPTVILLGDFNFRLQGISDAEVRAAVHSRNLDRILSRDELAPAIDPASAAEGKAGVFTGWKEGFISFPPTFKFSKGSDRYVGDPLPEGGDALEEPGRTVSGSSAEGPLDVASGITDAPSLSASAAAASSSQAPVVNGAAAAPTDTAEANKADDQATSAAPSATGAADGGQGGGKAVAEDDTLEATLSKVSVKSNSAGVELDIAQSPEGSSEVALRDMFGEGAADKNGATPTASSSGAAVLGRVQSTLGRQSSVNQTSQTAGAVLRERVRTPAWCDRILYRCSSSGKLAQLLYDRSELAVSDHKPVMSAFLLNAVSLDPQRLADECEAAQKALDLLANNAQPRCTVNENVLEVGELGYGEVVTRSCSLTCSGEVPARWKLTAPPGMEAGDSSGPNIPPWILVTPLSGMLTPGQTAEITFRIGVPDSSAATGSDPATAEKVVRRPDQPGSLSHMCVLHIENGADHFVLVEGTYKASFFGLTISTLSEREAGMAEEDLDACECSGDNMKHIFKNSFVMHQWAAIPQPLKKMLHFLARDDCLVTPGIFSESFQMIRSEAQADEVSAALNTEQPGRLPAVASVQAALDAGEKVPEAATAHDVAATILSYFKALPHPFFPESISDVCSAARPDSNKAASALKEALGGGAEWAVLCCTMRLLKLVIKVQADSDDATLQDRAKATFGGKVPTVSQRRSAIRSQLASCFADVWFPPINLEELDEHATADDYARLLQQAADASAKQAQFLQMFLM